MKDIKHFYPKGIKIEGTRLTPVGTTRKRGRMHYQLVCDCGKPVIADPPSITTGRVKSCGCLKKELHAEMFTTHGLSDRPEYFAAFNAFQRCHNPKSKYYKWYGERGIKCEFESHAEMAEWLVKHMPRPEGKYFLDRVNNDGNYSRTNLRWATTKESARNHRGTRAICIDGITKLLSEWAKEAGLNPMTLHSRIAAGFPQDMWFYKGKITKQVWIDREYSKQG